MSQLLIEAFNQNDDMEGGSKMMMSFSEFYRDVREHFSSTPTSYQQFKNAKTGRSKVEYLLQHPIVQATLKNLQSKNKPKQLNVANRNPQNCNNKCNAETDNGNDGLGGRECDIKLTGKGSRKYPQMSNKVDVKYSAKKGRHLVAKEKINPGDVLIVEKPYATVLYQSYYSSHCTQCFKRIADPKSRQSCPDCQEAIYCSKECREYNRKQFHWAECGLLHILQDDDIGHMALLVYRILVRAGLQTLVEISNGDINDITKSALYDSNDYRPVFLQVAHEELRDPGDLFKRSMVSLFLVHHLHHFAGYFGQDEINKADFFSVQNKNMITVVTLALRHLQSCSCNAYEIGELVRHKHGDLYKIDENLQLGGAVYSNISLSNHSCCHNTMRNNVGFSGVVRASKTIQNGEEISDNYGYYFQIKSTAERRSTLKAQYYFDCICTACRDNWPGYRDLPSGNIRYVCPGCKADVKKPTDKKCSKCKKELKLSKLLRYMAKLNEDVSKALPSLNNENVNTHLTHFTNILREMEGRVKHPCKEFIICQQLISQCFSLNSNMSTVLEEGKKEIVEIEDISDESDDDSDEDDENDLPELI